MRHLAPIFATTLVVAACNGDDTSAETSATGTAGSTSAATNATTTATTDGTATGSSSSMSGSASESDSGTSTAASTSTTGTTTDTSTSGTTGTTSTTGSTGMVSSTTDTGNTGDPPCMPGDMMGMGDVEKSFLWVANTDEGTIAKVDTQTVKELARYRSGPTGANEDPSRTAVSVDGRFVIVNNRNTGRTTMIAANVEDCKDKNNNGMIETSKNPADILAWDLEECILWSTVLPVSPGENGAGPRGVTWTPGDWDEVSCSFINPKVWVGYRPSEGVAHMARLNGNTGAVENTVVINNWFNGDTWWGPYGAALDASQKVWFTGLRGNLYSIDTKNNDALKEYTSPGDSQFYGMTVDSKGRTWTAGCAGPVYRFDPMNQQFTAVPGTDDCYRGIGADKEGHIWTAANFNCGVMQIDADTATVIQFHQLNPCTTPVGISVDTEGFVWVVDEWEGAWKIDPINTNNKQFLPIANEHYTYSDMTGGQLKSVILPQ